MPKSILVVDDDLTVTSDICKTVNELGYDTYSAQSAKEAFDIIVRQNVDLVLVDVLLPGKPGTHVRHLIKQSPLTRGVRVVYMTAYAPTSDTDPVPVVRKPFSSEELQQVLMQCFASPPPDYKNEVSI